MVIPLTDLCGNLFTEPVMLVETPSANVVVDAGSTVYYVCVGYDEDETDPPSITWKFGETPLTNGSSSLVTIYTKPVVLNNLTFTQSILELCGIQLKDDGNYSCSAIGSTNTTYTFELKVKVRLLILQCLDQEIGKIEVIVLKFSLKLLIAVLMGSCNCISLSYNCGK